MWPVPPKGPMVMAIAIVIADTTTSWKADVSGFFRMFLNISAQHLNLSKPLLQRVLKIRSEAGESAQ